jgi:hypothetical protein
MDPQLKQAQAATQEFMQEYSIDSRTMSAIGQMAKQAIQDPSLYAILREQLINAGIANEEELSKQINYMVLTSLAVMGAIAGGQ